MFTRYGEFLRTNRIFFQSHRHIRDSDLSHTFVEGKQHPRSRNLRRSREDLVIVSVIDPSTGTANQPSDPAVEK